MPSRRHHVRPHRIVVWTFVALVGSGIGGTGFGLWQAGYRPFVVQTGSMAPTHPSGDLLIVRPDEHYQVGDVITFRHSADPTDLITHRITELTTDGGFRTKGDANPATDVWTVRPDMIVGRTAVGLPNLGYAVIFFQQPTGIAALVAATIAVFLLWSLFFPAPATRPDPADSIEPEASGTADSAAPDPALVVDVPDATADQGSADLSGNTDEQGLLEAGRPDLDLIDTLVGMSARP